MFEIYRSTSATDPSAPYVVYPSSLFCLSLGYALWFPEPHQTVGEPQIGDVGYVSEGAFIRMFNINVSKPEYQISHWGVPFETTEAPAENLFRPDKRLRPIKDDHYVSRGVRKKEIQGSIST